MAQIKPPDKVAKLIKGGAIMKFVPCALDRHTKP